MNKTKIIIILVLLTSAMPLSANFYLGAGPEYIVPMGKMADLNASALGFNMQYESRNYCKLWYGFRLDYFAPDSADDNMYDDFMENALMLSPTIRYNFLGDDCYKYNYLFYVQGLFHFSSIGSTDKLSRMGLGAGLGLGWAYSFSWLKKCWMIDLEGMYSAPNAILRADGRDNFQFINVSLTLSIKL